MSYNNDFVIMYDENGQPYMAHSIRGRINNYVSNNKARDDHKYLERVDNHFGPGKHLYLYTQAEVDAFHNGGKRTLSNRVRDALGWDERSARDDAYANTKKNTSDSQHKLDVDIFKRKNDAYSKTALGRLEKAKADLKVNGVRGVLKRYGGTTLKAIRSGAAKAGKAIDDFGIDDAARMIGAKMRGVNSTEDLQKYQKAQYDWQNSTLGRGLQNAKQVPGKVGKAIDDLGIDEGYRYLQAKRNGVNNTDDLQRYQKAEYDWRNSTIGKRLNRKKK